MKAIELFPYWADERSLLAELVDGLSDGDLAYRPRAGLASIAELLRHLITTEEHWWRGGILGDPWSAWRPPHWTTLSVAEKDAYREARYPDRAAIARGLDEAHAPIEAFLTDLDAGELCEKRQATWGEWNTLRWIIWHLIEHDQHHRAQLATRLRLLGADPPPIFPRPGIMGQTPAARWHPDAEIGQVVPYWKHAHGVLCRAIAALSPADLAVRPPGGLPGIGDLVLHVIAWEDHLVGQMPQPPNDAAELPADAWRQPASHLWAAHGARFPTVQALVEALARAHDRTERALAGVTVADLAVPRATPWGPQTLHHALWHARAHLIHHRAQVFFQMRLLDREPPEL